MEGKEIIENMSKGDVKYHYFSNVKIRYRYLISVGGTNVCKIGRDDNDNSTQEKANALLICDAFNVANQTGLTPSQLQSELETVKEQNKKLTDCVNAGIELAKSAETVSSSLEKAIELLKDAELCLEVQLQDVISRGSIASLLQRIKSGTTFLEGRKQD